MSPNRRTFVPDRSTKVLTPAFPDTAWKGAPPPQSSYISGDHTVPSRSKATNFGNSIAQLRRRERAAGRSEEEEVNDRHDTVYESQSRPMTGSSGYEVQKVAAKL